MQDNIGKVQKNFFLSFLSFLCFHNKMHKLPDSAPCRANSPIEDPVMPPGALIDVARCLGSLNFHVWEKMHQTVKFSEYILDPASQLSVYSADLQTVMYS